MDTFRLLGEEHSVRKMLEKCIKSLLPFKNLIEEKKITKYINGNQYI